MIELSKTLRNEIKEGTASITEISDYLISNYPVKALSDALAELLMTQPVEPIIVSPEQLNSITSMFRVRGYRDISENIAERRGRPKKRNNTI